MPMAHSKMLDKASVQIPCGINMVPGDCPVNEKRCFPPRSVTTTPRNQSDTTTSPLLFSVMYLGILYSLCPVLSIWIVWVSCPDLFYRMILLGIWSIWSMNWLNIPTSRSPDVGEQDTQWGYHVGFFVVCINVVMDFISFESFLTFKWLSMYINSFSQLTVCLPPAPGHESFKWWRMFPAVFVKTRSSLTSLTQIKSGVTQ